MSAIFQVHNQNNSTSSPGLLGHRWLVMVNLTSAFSQSESGKYFEWIIIVFNIWSVGFTKKHKYKYRRWGLIKFALFCFGNALLSRCLLCPYLKGVDLKLINLPFSSASRSVFSNIFRVRHLASVINTKSQNPSLRQSTASSSQFYFLVNVRIRCPSSLL